MKVLLVEDDPQLAELLDRVLTEEGHALDLCKTLGEARAKAGAGPYDVVVLDWMLPDGEGLTLCDELRRAGVLTPILMLTARGEVQDRVLGLRTGADDYLVKPFDIDELLARLFALTRRAVPPAVFRHGGLEIDRLAREARVQGRKVDLTQREFALLARLADDVGRAVPRAALFEGVWQLRFDPGSGVLEVHVSRLRDKLGEYAWMVETVRGVGYRLRTER
ncbi:MAG TPA: response regulator transcription factor [Polyangiaceae bacterium]|nr:response regulator transcription factor [Polyangiaceae bacterium]